MVQNLVTAVLVQWLIQSTRKLEDLTADVEGMTIYYGKDENKGDLICSSQGNSTFQVYDRESNKYLHSFTICATKTIDVTTETDGCDASNVDFGDPYS